jgi:hypothetical protein
MTTRCRNAPAAFSLTYVRGGNPFSRNLTLNNFNLNLGIGQNSSSLNVQLLWGGCGNFSNEPPSLPTIGRAMRFSCNNLEFSGIVNTVNYEESANGFLFNLTLIDPKKLLENVTVMYKGYYCNTIPLLANFINVLPDIERGAALCPPGDDTQNWPRVGNCGNFGTSGLDGFSPNNGVHTLKVVRNLTNKTVYTTSGEALTLNLSSGLGGAPGLTDALFSRAYWSRLNGESQSVIQIIEQACNDVACDYFVELVGSTIFVRLIDRSIVQNPAVITNIIRQGKASGTLISGEEGYQEIYEESNRIIIGDNVQYLAESCETEMVVGYDSKGNIQKVKDNNFRVVVDIRPLKEILEIGNLPDDWLVSEEEMIFSRNLQMWLLYGLTINNNSLSRGIINALNLDGQADLRAVLDAFNKLNNPGGQDPLTTWKKAKVVLEGIPQLFVRKVNYTRYSLAHEWFSSFVKEWYGTRYLVAINDFCLYPATNRTFFRGDTGQFYMSDVPEDSGYPSFSQMNNLRGLIPFVDTDLFETSDGKLNGFVEVNQNATFSKRINGKDIQFKIAPKEMTSNSFISKNNKVYLQASSFDKTVIRNPGGFPQILLEVATKVSALPWFGQNFDFLLNRGLSAFTVLFGIDKYEELYKRVKGFSDISSFNIFDLESGAGGISCAVVPMRSNMYVYGPWIGTKGAVGSTSVRVQGDLSPWNYGGYGQMNFIGNAMAQNGLRITNTESSASFVLAEPPGYNVHYFLQAGIFVDTIYLTYDGTSGVTTRYSFKTFTSKFGEAGQSVAELAKENNRIRNNVIGQIRDERRKRISAINTALSKIANSITQQFLGNFQAQNAPSPGFLIMGGYYNFENDNNGGSGGLNKEVNVKTELTCEELCDHEPNTYNTPPDGDSSKPKIYEIGLNKKHGIEAAVEAGEGLYTIAIMSFDGLVSPVSTEGRNGRLSPYALWFDTGMDRSGDINNLTKSRPSMPPIDPDARLPINQKYLNPILSKKLLDDWSDGRGISDKGFNIMYVSFGQDVADLRDEDKRDRETDFGFSALRGPLVLQSWGYDTENKPVPNIIDSPRDAETGIFKNDGTKNKFMKNWLQNPKTWPVGPIDLRWDRDRGLWVCPPPDRIVVAQLLTDLSPYGSSRAILLNPGSDEGLFYENYGIYGPNGENITSDVRSSSIIVSDFLGRTLCAGTKIYAAFNDGKYIVLESSVVNEETCECICATTETTETDETETTETDETETDETEPCDCGLGSCIPGGAREGVLGFDGNGCLTIYDLTECADPEIETQTPTEP